MDSSCTGEKRRIGREFCTVRKEDGEVDTWVKLAECADLVKIAVENGGKSLPWILCGWDSFRSRIRAFPHLLT